ISKLFFPINIPQKFADGLPCLKEYISKYGYKKPLKLAIFLENQPPDSRKRERISKRLLNTLNKRKYEPLWREIFGLIKESQSEYPSQAELFCNAKLLAETRGEIQRLMEAEGYSGTYPDFHKKGSIKGVRLAESYNMDYLVGAEKNAVFRVHCTEEAFNGNLSVELLCGSELLKKNEAEGDIYSCTFDARGRRFFTTVSYNSGVEEDSEIQDSLGQKVKIAAKRAELKRLTKEERKALYGFDMPYLRIFAAIFIFAGGLFGIFMTLGLMLMAVLFALIDGQPQTVPSMITDIPWWFCLVFSWVTFGGAMGIITVLSKRK
ncbi:MAG: hypothetical protein ACI4F7_06565, partial [Acutalibacteraceae bacterium]